MNDIDKSKLADALIADAVADIGALYDLDLTKEEVISCVDMIRLLIFCSLSIISTQLITSSLVKSKS